MGLKQKESKLCSCKVSYLSHYYSFCKRTKSQKINRNDSNRRNQNHSRREPRAGVGGPARVDPPTAEAGMAVEEIMAKTLQYVWKHKPTGSKAQRTRSRINTKKTALGQIREKSLNTKSNKKVTPTENGDPGRTQATPK